MFRGRSCEGWILRHGRLHSHWWEVVFSDWREAENLSCSRWRKTKKEKKRKKIQKEKAMYLAAVAQPRYDPNRKAMWDGKIGIWPFVEKVPAMRNSKNRPKGTLETKQVSVTTEVYCCSMFWYVDMLINKLLPAIEAKWPKGTLRKLLIRIQQDNASPHKGKAMEEKA